jgi:hypothetical protein
MNYEANSVEIKPKQVYEPPRVVTISLRPEEAVLGHCKTMTGGNNFSFGGCTPIGLCSSVGS